MTPLMSSHLTAKRKFEDNEEFKQPKKSLAKTPPITSFFPKNFYRTSSPSKSPRFALSAIDQSRVDQQKPEKTILKTKAVSSRLSASQDSDGEFSNHEDSKHISIFSRQKALSAKTMTIACPDKNIKGSTLITLVHNIIRKWYNNFIDGACEYERDLGGAAIPSPKVVNGLLSIQDPREWLMTLGGWKGMMPSEEVKEYLFNQFTADPPPKKTFTGVKIYQSNVIYPIIDGRLHLPKNFSINGIDITGYWEKQGNNCKRIPTGKTDLSYGQITDAIKIVKEQFDLEDSDIADIQLGLLIDSKDFPEVFKEVPQKNQQEIVQFLHYVNGLMFGIEASGLNAALAIGLMTLELIAGKQFNYQTAFNANKDGGVYPYACFGNNQGTYSERNRIVLGEKHYRSPYSMKRFRHNPSLSPVALKEAILIKKWLVFNKIISDSLHESQLEKIKEELNELIDYYFLG